MPVNGIAKHIYHHCSVLNRSSNSRREEGWCSAETPWVGLGRSSLSSLPRCPLGPEPTSGRDSAIWAEASHPPWGQHSWDRHREAWEASGGYWHIAWRLPAWAFLCSAFTEQVSKTGGTGRKRVTLTLRSAIKFCQPFHLKSYWFRHTPKIIVILF